MMQHHARFTHTRAMLMCGGSRHVYDCFGHVHAKPLMWMSHVQVVLFRALKAGDLESFADEASLHPEAIHENFTKVNRDK
jgi:hypothetical protein